MKPTQSNSDLHRPFVLHTRVVTGTGGGPEKTILNSPRYLQKYGCDSACLFMKPPGDPGFSSLQKKAQAASAEVIGIDDRGPLDWRVIRDTINICRDRTVTIWHAHDYKSNALGLLVRRFHPMHLVTTAHGWVRFTARTPLYYKIDRFCLKRYEQVICVSQDLFDECRTIQVPMDRLQMIDNAIVLDDYCTEPATTSDRVRFGFDSGVLLLGAAGRLSEEKGFHHLIDAVGKLIRNGYPIGLLIAGEGHLRTALQAQIDEQLLQSHIKLTGFLADPRELYRAIDVFTLSSIREGLPNVVLEAMASQRPIVTTNCNGIPRLVFDQQNGIVVRADSCESLYDGILQCVTSESLRQRLAAAGRKTVEEQFCFDRRMKKIISVYSRLSHKLADYLAPRLNTDSDPLSAAFDTDSSSHRQFAAIH